MKSYVWNAEKNDWLKEERSISFEDVVLNIQLGNEVDIYDHPNQKRYLDQKVSVVFNSINRVNRGQCILFCFVASEALNIEMHRHVRRPIYTLDFKNPARHLITYMLYSQHELAYCHAACVCQKGAKNTKERIEISHEENERGATS